MCCLSNKINNIKLLAFGIFIFTAYLLYSKMIGELIYPILFLIGTVYRFKDTKNLQIPSLKWIVSVINQVVASYSCKTIKLARVCC